jgi:hypothetical protein
MLNRINDWLSIGNYRVMMDLGLLLKHNVGTILELAERVNDGEYLHHDLIAQGRPSSKHSTGKANIFWQRAGQVVRSPLAWRR